jgi:sulfatase maturation enzyme AslB (radical SAM superfamily)
MPTDLQKIAQLLENSRPLALWGLGNDALCWINTLRKEYNLSPSCIIDSDTGKHGKKFFGIPILPYSDALSLYPDLEIYVVGGNYKYQIMGNLIEKYDFPHARIINYEPTEKRRGCVFIENVMLCAEHKLHFCCSDFGKKKSPSVAFDGDYGKALREWTNLRETLASKLAIGEHTPCDGCNWITKDYYASERKIRWLNYAEGGVCNFNCEYCTAVAKNKATGTYRHDISLANLFKHLSANGMLPDNPHADFAPGEPALYKKTGETLTEIENSCFPLILTNGSVYSEKIAQSLRSGRAALYVSLDSGTRETFAAIKGVDAFPQVIDNLRKYAKCAPGVIGLKYIFLPGRNDNAQDVDGFVELVEELGSAFVFLSYDFYSPVQILSKNTFASVSRMVEQLDSNGRIWKNISDVIARAFAGELL